MYNNKEDELKKLILEDCNMRIQTGRNARRSFLQFLVSINLAYFGALYFLIENNESCLITLLSCIIFLVNFSLFVMYVREHNAEEDNEEQKKMIFKSYYPGLYSKESHSYWFKFHSGFKDKFEGVTYFVVSLLFIFFTLFPIFINFFIWNFLVKIIIFVLTLLGIEVLTYFAHFYSNKKERDNLFKMNLLKGIIIFIYAVTIVIIITCLYKYFDP